MSEYYTASGNPATGSSGSSAAIRAESALVSAGFDKLPTLSGNASQIVAVNATGTALEAIATVPVAQGGTGVATLTDGGILLGSGTGAITALAVLADGEMIVGDGTTDPAIESDATLRTSIGVGTGDSPTFTGLTVTGTATLATVDINAGAIDGTTVGTTVASTGDFTTLIATTLSLSGSAVTTGIVLDVPTADSLTTGSIANFTSNSTNTSSRSLVRMINNNTLATGATVLNIRQDAAQTALFLDQNANASSLVIDSESTTVSAVNFITPMQTTGSIFRIVDANSLTTGRILTLVSNSTSTATRELVLIHNDNTLALATVVLNIRQDAASTALFIDQNANSRALIIDTQATSADGLVFSFPTQTTGTILSIEDADSLTTGNIAVFESNSADTGSRSLIQMINDNTLATGTTVLEIRQEALQRAVTIDQNGNANALFIDSEATTNPTINVDSTNTSGIVLRMRNTNSLTTGNIINAHSNSASTATRDLVKIINDNVSATGATCLSIQQDAAKNAVFIDQNADGTSIEIQSSATTADVFTMNGALSTTGSILVVTSADSLTTGAILNLQSNSSDVSVRSLAFLLNDNTSAIGTRCLHLRQDAANVILLLDHDATAEGSAFIDFQAAAVANAVNPISTLTTSGATTHHIQVEINAVKAWIAVSTNDPT